MAIKFIINGQGIECDSADDAAAIIGAMGSGKRRQAPRQVVRKGRASERPCIAPNVLELLKVLKEAHPNELTTTDLAGRLNKSPKSLPPIVTALSKWAHTAGLEPSAIMLRKSKLDNGRPISFYVITDEGVNVVNREMARELM